MNTMIIARHTGISNPQAKIRRQSYTITNGKGRVVRSSAKVQKLGLTARRVANGALFNNQTLTYVSPDYGSYHCTVGLKFRGTEYKYEGIPVVWKKDHRKIYRRHIKQADFRRLPQRLQDVAKGNGVDVDADYIIFTRCIAAWAGHKLDSSLHCHHANMDTTDDRLGNIQVLTASDHARAHSNDNDMLWDEEWFEYTSQSALILRLQQREAISDEDIAKELPALMYLPFAAKKALEKDYFPEPDEDDSECVWFLGTVPPG